MSLLHCKVRAYVYKIQEGLRKACPGALERIAREITINIQPAVAAGRRDGWAAWLPRGMGGEDSQESSTDGYDPAAAAAGGTVGGIGSIWHEGMATCPSPGVAYDVDVALEEAIEREEEALRELARAQRSNAKRSGKYWRWEHQKHGPLSLKLCLSSLITLSTTVMLNLQERVQQERELGWEIWDPVRVDKARIRQLQKDDPGGGGTGREVGKEWSMERDAYSHDEQAWAKFQGRDKPRHRKPGYQSAFKYELHT